MGEGVESGGLELQLAWRVRVDCLRREDVLSLLVPSALSQLLSVPLLLPRQPWEPVSSQTRPGTAG